MKILLISIHFPPLTGGIENYLHQLIKHCPGEVTVVTPKVKGWDEFDRRQNFSIQRTPCNINYIFSSPLLFRLVLLPLNILLFLSASRKVKTGRYSIIISGSADSILAASCLARWFKLPLAVITYGRDVISRSYLSLWKRGIIHKLIRQAGIVFAISRFTRQILLQAGVKSENIVQITPGINPDTLPLSPGRMEEINARYGLNQKPVILTVGRLVPRKGHQQVLEVLPELVKKFPKLVYLIVGKGPYRLQLESLVQDWGLENHVIFTGAVSPEILAACYQRCQLMVMPSKSDTADAEGFGIVYLEAGLFSKPVIGVKAGGVTDAVQDGVTGILIEPDAPRELIQAISRLLEDKVLAAKLGKAGREKALSQLWPQKSKYFYQMLSTLSESKDL